MEEKCTSPVGWFIGSYLLRFVELGEEGNDDPEARFLSWENTILVKACDITEAYEKVVKSAKKEIEPYKGGPTGVPVQWVFEGVTELLPVYEQLADGAEVMWRESKPRKLKNLRKMVRSREEWCQ